MKPSFIVHRDDVPEQEGHYPAPFDAERLSAGRDLGRAAGSQRIGAWLERLAPGRRTSFTHAHSHDEEMVYVLSGPVWVRLVQPGQAPDEHRLETGAFVSFPSGTGIAHTFWNRGDADVELLVMGERIQEDQVFYPEDTAFDAWHAETRPNRHWSR